MFSRRRRSYSELSAGKLKIVDYRAKWLEDSFEFENTPRTYDFLRKNGLFTQHDSMRSMLSILPHARIRPGDNRVDPDARRGYGGQREPVPYPDGAFTAAALAAAHVRRDDRPDHAFLETHGTYRRNARVSPSALYDTTPRSTEGRRAGPGDSARAVRSTARGDRSPSRELKNPLESRFRSIIFVADDTRERSGNRPTQHAPDSDSVSSIHIRPEGGSAWGQGETVPARGATRPCCTTQRLIF